MRIVESFNRNLLRALASQFASPYEAVRELVDNALDHSMGQRVEVDLWLAPGSLVVLNLGGRGMGPEELARFVSWGAANGHEAGDIGHYGQGGKSAVLALGGGFRLWCRRAGTSEVYALEEGDLLGRSGAADYGEAVPLPESLVPEALRRAPRERGLVRLEVLGLREDLSLSADGLARDIAAVYAERLRSGSATIRVGGRRVEPREPFLDGEVERAAIDVELDGARLTGWAGKLAKGLNKGSPPRPGLALFWNGRRILEGEWFSQNSYGKGSLASFYGEVSVEGWTPNLNKTGFVESGSVAWERAGAEAMRQAAPVLDALRSASDPTRVTERDRRVARRVSLELGLALKGLAGAPFCVEVEETRRVRIVPAAPGEARVRERDTGAGSGERMPPPFKETEDVERKRQREGRGLAAPDIRVDSWDGPSRAETRTVDGRPVIYINKSHPAYAASNARFAIAEGAILEMLRAHGGLEDIDEYLAEADQALAAWAAAADDEE